VRVSTTRALLAPVEEVAGADVDAIFTELEAAARARLTAEDDAEAVAERWVGLRYRDQWHELALPVGDVPQTLAARFSDEHERRFGTRLDDPVQAVDCWVTVVAPRAGVRIGSDAAEELPAPAGARRRLAHYDADAAVTSRASIAEAGVSGPALVEESGTVTVVPPGALARMRAGHLVIELRAEGATA
jgi:N-methylhydantoinase A